MPEIPQNAPKQGKDISKLLTPSLATKEWKKALPSHPIYSRGWSAGAVLTTNPFSEKPTYEETQKAEEKTES